MSNMYTILDSLKKVTPKQEPLENKKPQAIYESVEAKGSILEGVAKVEEKLKEQFAKFNEGDTEYKNGVTKHKGTYGTEYQGDPDDEDAPKRGRPARGTAKKEKVVRVKGPKGRPKKDPVASAPAKIGNDPFGRVPDKAPKGAKGTVVKGKATQDTNEDQINELSPELLKRARDKAGMKYADADDRKDKKASDKYNAQDDKFNSALRKKQKDMAEGAIMEYDRSLAIPASKALIAALPRMSSLGYTQEDKACVEKFISFLQRGDTHKARRYQKIKGGCTIRASNFIDEILSDANINPDAEFQQPVLVDPRMRDRDMTEAENPFASFKKQAKGAGLLRSKTKTKTMESSQRLAKLLIEGVNFTEMVKKKDMTLQEMLAELQADIQSFKETGHCSELLRDCMEVHSYGKSQLNDATENPMDNDNFPMPLAPAQAPSMMDRAKRMGGHVLNKLGHGSDEDLKADLRRKMGMQEAAELNELARLAGLTVKEANDGNLANNAKPYNDVTQADVVAGRLGNDAMGGNAEVDEGDESQPAVRIINDFDEVVDQFDHVPKGFRDALRSSKFDAVQWLADIMKKDPDFDITTIEKIVLRPGVYGPDEHVIDVTEYLDHLDEGSESNIRDTLAYEIRMILDGALADYDQTDHIVDELGDIFNDIEASGDREAMMAYEMMVDAIDTDADTQVDAARQALKLLNLDEGDMEEGAGVMHFKAQQAKADGKDSFKLGDEEFPVQEAGFPRIQAGIQKYTQTGINKLAKLGREGASKAKMAATRKEFNQYDESMTEDDMEEGNEFSGNRDDAIKAGKTEFEVDGKTYPVKEASDDTCNNDADRELAKLKENCGIVSPIGSMAQDMQQQQGKMSINTNQSSDGTKNISISADGEAADQLMQILKMAGMAGGQQQHAEVVVTAEPMEAKQYGNTDIDKPKEVVNTPRPDVRGMHRAETVGYADTTDDLNKQKDQDPETANRAANPKTPKANRVEESHPLESLGAKLMAEYQSIKLTK